MVKKNEELNIMYSRMSLSTVYVVFSVIHVSSVLCQLMYNMDTCTHVTFHRRPEMDDLVFTGGLVQEINQVDMRAECFSQCQWQMLCNLVLYNSLTRKCRLNSEAYDSSSDGFSETGWQYYGVSCDSYRLANTRPGVDIINAAVGDVCQEPFHVRAATEPSSCLRDASGESIRIKCTPCYTGTTVQSWNPTTFVTEDLPFDLSAGMTFRVTVAGVMNEYNKVFFELPNSDRALTVSVRWRMNGLSRAKLVFNTLLGGVFGQKEERDPIDIQNNNYYQIEIQITNVSFKVFVDGTFWMENQMRVPLTGVRRIVLYGFTAIHTFQIFVR